MSMVRINKIQKNRNQNNEDQTDQSLKSGIQRINKLRVSRRGKIVLVTLLCVILLNVLSWHSTAFCDFYVAHIFPVWVNLLGRLTGIWPFSVGEVMLAAGVLLVMAAVLFGMAAAGLFLFGKIEGKADRQESGKIYRGVHFLKFCRGFYRFFGYTCVTVSVIMTLNCFILYHCSTFEVKYLGGAGGEYTFEELLQLRNHVVERANRLAEQMPRDEAGNLLYEGDMKQTAIMSMQALGGEYEQLAGYYPRPKGLYASGFFSQQWMQGYYFPFSMEANYNQVMYISNKPATMCHELAHVKGFIYEDEANLIGYLACVQSEDAFFQYSGYLSVLSYIERDFQAELKRNADGAGSEGETDKGQESGAFVEISELVLHDRIFLTQESWQQVEERALFSTETVSKASDIFIDTNLVVNGIPDGKRSYNRVVGLLLHYYREHPIQSDSFAVT